MKPSSLLGILVLFFALVLTSATIINDAADDEDTDEITRLSKLHDSVIPLNYTISLRPWNFENDIKPGRMAGVLFARVRATKADRIIEVNQDKLFIEERDVEVISQTGESLLISNFTIDNHRQILRLQMEEPFKVGDELLLCIPFGVTFLSPLKTVDGLYLRPGISVVNFTDPENSNKTRTFAITRLLPRKARKVFPLFDDPKFSTPFQVIVARHKSWSKGYSISNMEIVRTEENSLANVGGWVEDHFKETPPIPPHQLFILLSDHLIPFRRNYGSNGNETEVTVWTTNLKTITNIESSSSPSESKTLEAADKLVAFYEHKFNWKYFGKLDIVLLPEFREINHEGTLGVILVPSLLNQEYTPPQNKEFARDTIVKTLAEKIAEQFYGVIVQFLYSGSSYSDYTSISKGIPPFLQQWGLSYLNATSSPGEILGLASQSTLERYLGSLLWMLEDFLGVSIIESALTKHFLPRAHKHRSLTTQDDFYLAIDKAIKNSEHFPLLPPNEIMPPLKEIMDPWTHTEKYDYPLLRVSMSAESDSSINLEQEMFDSYYDPEVEPKPSGLWIPVKVLHNDKSERLLFSPNDTRIKYFPTNLRSENLFLANPNGAGYYRTWYCPTLTNQILKQLNSDHNVISTSGRIQLVDDFVTLALKNYTRIERAFEITKYLEKEKNPSVWRSVLDKLVENVYNPIRENDEVYGSFRRYFVSRLEAILESSGEVQSIFKDTPIVTWCLRFEVPSCVQYANDLMNTWRNDPSANQVSIFPSIVSAYVWQCAAVANYNETNFAFILSKYKETTTRAIKDEYLYVLTCSKNITLVTSVLEDEQDEYSLDRLLQFLQHRRRPELRKVLYEFGKRIVVSRKFSPEVFRRIVSFIEMYSSHPTGFVEELRQFIKSNEEYLSPVMTRLDTHLRDISICQRCAFWTQTGNSIANWLVTNNQN